MVLLAADQGQVDVDPATTVYVNEAWPEIAGLPGARPAAGRPARPRRAPRATSSCTAGPRRSTTWSTASSGLLGERATVHRVADVVAAGWLGSVGERLRARLADVCVPARTGETVWWRERHRFDMRFRGHHGGPLEDEALTQVAALVV
jgi:hypothetical protein